MKNEFYTIIEIKKNIKYFRKIIINFPKSKYILKNNIEEYSLRLLEYTYKANIIKEERLKYQKEIIIILKMLDYYFYLAYQDEIINQDKYLKLAKYLINIYKYIYGWIKSEKSK